MCFVCAPITRYVVPQGSLGGIRKCFHYGPVAFVDLSGTHEFVHAYESFAGFCKDYDPRNGTIYTVYDSEKYGPRFLVTPFYERLDLKNRKHVPCR